MRNVHAGGKNAGVMGNAMNVENIMPSLNVRYLLPVKKEKKGRILQSLADQRISIVL